eukprot:365096-Chlamydomonas_euryale.AAC.2
MQQRWNSELAQARSGQRRQRPGTLQQASAPSTPPSCSRHRHRARHQAAVGIGTEHATRPQ